MKRFYIQAVLIGVVICLSTAVSAKTCTWQGGANGVFTDAKNWKDSAVPAAGDTLVYSTPTSITNTLASGTFAVSAATTFNVGSGVTVFFSVPLNGSGEIRKSGAGKLTFYSTKGTASSHASTNKDYVGNIYVQDGILEENARYEDYLFGQGSITIQKSGNVQPRLVLSTYDSTIANKIHVVGKNDSLPEAQAAIGGAIYIAQHNTLNGAINGADDFSIFNNYREATINGDITAKGRTVVFGVETRYEAASSGHESQIKVNGKVEANVYRKSLSKYMQGLLSFYGEVGEAESWLRVDGGTNVFDKAAKFIGSKVEVHATEWPTILELGAGACLTPQCDVTLVNSGNKRLAKLRLPNGVSLCVTTLTVDGVALEAGLYSKTNLKDYIVGDGSVMVAGGQNYNIWTGAMGDGKWRTASNWGLGHAPKAGETAYFDHDTTIAAGTVDIGDAGLTIMTTAKLTTECIFTGTGKVTKLGPGIWETRAVNIYEGGTDIKGGEVYGQGVANGDTDIFGSGEIDICEASDSQPTLWLNRWDAVYTRKIVVHGMITNNLGAIYNSNRTTIRGRIIGDGSFRIRNHYAELLIERDITLPEGCFVDLFVEGNTDSTGKHNPVTTCHGPINASVVKSGAGPLVLEGVQTRFGDSLTVNGGTSTLAATAVWGGRDIAVNSKGAVLELTAVDNLDRRAQIAVTKGGKLLLRNAEPIKVAGLSIDGKALDDGTYTAKELPDVIAGDGMIIVQRYGGMFMMVY